MARSLRIEYPNACYHVTQRGFEGGVVFLSDRDRFRFYHYLGLVHDRYGAIVHTLVLMTNHFHLAMETPRANLSRIMHCLNTSYSAYFNTKQGRHGPLYQGRFKAQLVQRDSYLHQLSRYIHLNPVRAGIVGDPLDYRWSSLEYFVTRRRAPRWLRTEFILSTFAPDEEVARELYLQFVLDGMGHEGEIIGRKIKEEFILGDEHFSESIKKEFIYGKENPEIPMLRKIQREPSLPDIHKMVGQTVTGGKRLQRKVAVYLSRRYTQKTLGEIGEFFGGIRDAGVSQSFRRTEKEREKNPGLNVLLAELERLLNV